MIVLGVFAIFFTATVAMAFAAFWAIRFAAKALNANRAMRQRLTLGAAALGCALAAIGATVAGFSGMAAVMYLAQTAETAP